ncbi:MAG: DUF3008 family protein, partial [Bacteroidales bacterium]|nr:DUF3008 family protein [Bacteroidales bacterium]
MTAESKSQQRLMGMAYAYKTGKLELNDMPSEMQDKIKSIADSMTEKDLKDFAATKHKNLPEVKETFVLSFNDFLNEGKSLYTDQVYDDSVFLVFNKLSGQELRKIENNLKMAKNYLSSMSFDDLDPKTKSLVYNELKALKGDEIKESKQNNMKRQVPSFNDFVNEESSLTKKFKNIESQTDVYSFLDKLKASDLSKIYSDIILRNPEEDGLSSKEIKQTLYN